MAVTAGMVKELREMTGAGMMDCKKLLQLQMAIWISYRVLKRKGELRLLKAPDVVLQQRVLLLPADG